MTAAASAVLVDDDGSSGGGDQIQSNARAQEIGPSRPGLGPTHTGHNHSKVSPSTALKFPTATQYQHRGKGCANSKQVEVAMTADVYHPPPASIALLDISKIDVPWLFNNVPAVDEKLSKPTTLSLPLLETIESLELAPKSWSEVSKAFEDLKPSFDQSQVWHSVGFVMRMGLLCVRPAIEVLSSGREDLGRRKMSECNFSPSLVRLIVTYLLVG
ncbi:hypothetical protein KSP40_PGU015446 [Platanthera guangdongensis]|uniref:Uncharacterized protein n=1 Tax=Platanthera guangdongensis TaxID=2320717 RepID=A0ABR2MUU4_9ASPA